MIRSPLALAMTGFKELVIILVISQNAYAHVRLTFPPARYPSLDFLDSVRTTGPCGIPKPPYDKGQYTELQAGSRLNVTWFQSYPHQGGFRIEILNRNDEPTLSLTPEPKKFHSADIGTEWFEVELPPELECEHCAIRLIRQAEEWGNYMFWSCADVTITRNFTQTCSKHGQFDGVHCQCERLFSGSQCQYKDDCWIDSDCGSFGACKNQSGSPYPKRVCYCQPGYYGRHCEKVSDLKSPQFDESQYQLKTVGSDKNKIYWRIWQGKEIEFVLQFPTKSWMAVGWRPKGLNKQCQLQPRHNLTTTEKPSIVGITQTLSETKSIQTTTTISLAVDTTIIGNGKTVGEVHGKSEQNVTESEIPTPPVFSSGPQSTFFLETKPQPPATTEIISASSELQLNRTFPPIIGTPETFYPGLGQVSFLPATFELQPNMVHHIKLESTPASNVTKGQTAAGGLKEATTQEQINTTASLFTEEPEQTAYTVPLQLANGTIKPVAKTSTTTEKTTTKQESHNETVKTTAKTAKAEILTTESAVIVNGSVPLGSIPAGLKTAINVGPSEPGTKTSNSPLNQQPPNPLAAFPEISKVVGESCYGEWKWPPQCIDSNHPPPGRRSCDYRASWSYREETDDIEFSLQTRGPNNWWTGIGFSKTGTMLDADMIIVTSESGEIKVKDMHSTGYASPELDAVQNVKSQGGTHVNGVIRVGFTRPRATLDKENDAQFTDVDCFYMLFPTTGGRMEQGQISKHRDVPKNSTVPVCIRKCPNKPATSRSCLSEFKYPPGCTAPDCDYRATWKYDETKDDVSFEITSKELGRWTGIGFSKDGNMTNSDMIVGWIYDDQPYITDRFAYGKHQPAIDAVQNLDGISGRKVNEYQTLQFRRKVDTPDSKEDLPLSECLYFLFPVGGGRVIARSASEFGDKTSSIGFHDLYIPRVTKEPVCICTDKGEPIGQKKHKRQAATLTPDPFFFGSNNEKSTDSILTTEIPVTADTKTNGNLTGAVETTDRINVATEEAQVSPTPTSSLNISQIFNNVGAILDHFTGGILPNNSINTLVKSVGTELIQNNSNINTIVKTVGDELLQSGNNSSIDSLIKTVGSQLLHNNSLETLVKNIGNFNSNISEESSTIHTTSETVEDTKAQTTPIITEPNLIQNTTESSFNITSQSEIGSKATVVVQTSQEPIENATESSVHISTTFSQTTASELVGNVTEPQIIVASTNGHQSLPEPVANETQAHPEPAGNATQPHAEPAGNATQPHAEPVGNVTQPPAELEANATQPHAEPEANATQPHAEPGANVTQPHAEPEANATQPHAEPVGHAAQAHAEPVGNGSQPHPEPVGNGTQSESEAYKDEVENPMDCADIVVATVIDGSLSRIGDFYTISRATPRPDSFYMGDDSLTSAVGFERDGVTTVMFRKPLQSSDPADHSIYDERMTVIWAKGQEGIYYQPNALKYHGANNRGTFDVNFYESPHFLSNSNKTPVSNGGDKEEKSYYVHLYLPKLEWNSELEDPNSPKYNELSQKLKEDVAKMLGHKLSGFKGVKDIKFTNGSVHAHMEVNVEGHSAKEIRSVLTEEFKDERPGELGRLVIDPQSVEVKKIEERVNDEALRNYIIIAVVGFLVLVCVMFAAFMIIRTRQRRSKTVVMTANPYVQHPGQFYYNYAGGQIPPIIPGSKTSSDRSRRKEKADAASQHSNESAKLSNRGAEESKPTEMQQLDYDPYATGGVYMSNTSAMPTPAGFYRPY